MSSLKKMAILDNCYRRQWHYSSKMGCEEAKEPERADVEPF